jgi:Transposase, Mutator family
MRKRPCSSALPTTNAALTGSLSATAPDPRPCRPRSGIWRRIPKLRAGSFFVSLLERRRVDGALFAVVTEAYVHGVSTRKVDDLVKALGADTGISKSEVSQICVNLNEDVAAFPDRPLADQAYPYVFLAATYCKGPPRTPRRFAGRSRRGLRSRRTGAGRSSASRSVRPNPNRSSPRSSGR